MGDVTPLLDSDNTVRKVSVDRISTRDGGAAATDEEVQLVKNGWGAENDLKSTSLTTPMPIRDYGPSSAITSAGAGPTSFTTSQTVVSANTSRNLLIISNGHATIGVWLSFGATAAVVGSGVYLPPKATLPIAFRGEVRAIPESGTGGPIGYVEL